MPGDKDFQNGPVRVIDYKESILYGIIQACFREGKLKEAITILQETAKSSNVDKKHLNMFDVLMDACKSGDASEKMVAQLRKTADELFNEMAKKGMIATNKQQIL